METFKKVFKLSSAVSPVRHAKHAIHTHAMTFEQDDSPKLGKPLSNIKVIEFAGLAPGPLCGQLLADYGAQVVRIDAPNKPSIDRLCKNKRSIALNLKEKGNFAVARDLLMKADVVIDPYRPGVLEKLGLGPKVFLDPITGINKRLIFARLTGYGQTTSKSHWAGHDLGYLAESGVLDTIGPPGKAPVFPANILGDFAGLSLPGFASISLALYEREMKEKRGTEVSGRELDVNIVQAVQYLGLFVSHGRYPDGEGGIALFEDERGTNVLDGGSPYYQMYETADKGEFLAVAPIEEQFYTQFLEMVGLDIDKLPNRFDSDNWTELKDTFAQAIASKGVQHWREQCDKYPNSSCAVMNKLAKPTEVKDQIVTWTNKSSNGYKHAGFAGSVLEANNDAEDVIKSFLGDDYWTKVKAKL